MIEVTSRTLDGQHLLRPDKELEETFLGILAKAREKYPVDYIGSVLLSNHYHLYLAPTTQFLLSRFMGYVNTNLSKEVNRLRGRSGPVFARRYKGIPVTCEEPAQVERLKYLLSQGVKENLVERVEDWPGAHVGKALLEGRTHLTGKWIDRTRECRLRNRGREIDPEEITTFHELPIAKLPCWAHLSNEEYASRVREIVREVELEAAARRRLEGKNVLGRRRILAVDPSSRPARSERRPAPRVHAATRKARETFREARRWFVTAYREAAQRLRDGASGVRFPQGCFPPGLPYVGPTGMPSPVALG